MFLKCVSLILRSRPRIEYHTHPVNEEVGVSVSITSSGNKTKETAGAGMNEMISRIIPANTSERQG